MSTKKFFCAVAAVSLFTSSLNFTPPVYAEEAAHVEDISEFNKKLQEADKFFDDKNYKNAIKSYDEAIALNPNNAEAYFKRANAHVEMMKIKLDGYGYQRNYKLDDATSRPSVQHSFTNSEEKNYNRALEDYSIAIKIDSNNSIYYYSRGMVYYLSAKAYNDKAKYKIALKDFTNAIEINPNYAEAYIKRSSCYQAIGDEKNASADFTKALSMGYQVSTLEY